MIGVFRAPPIQGLGNAGGFKLQTEQHGYVDLGGAANDDRSARSTRPAPTRSLPACFTMYRADTPQLFVDIDRAKVQSLQVPIQDVFTTLQVYMGGYYVNLFNKFGRTWQVNVQADPAFAPTPTCSSSSMSAPGSRAARWCRWARSLASNTRPGP